MKAEYEKGAFQRLNNSIIRDRKAGVNRKAENEKRIMRVTKIQYFILLNQRIEKCRKICYLKATERR